MGNTLDYFTADAARPMPYDVKTFWRCMKSVLYLSTSAIVWSKTTRLDPVEIPGFLALFVGLAGTLLVIACVFVHVGLLAQRNPSQPVMRLLFDRPPIGILIAVSLISIALFTSVLPRLGFAVSRPFLESLADDVAAGRPVTTARVCGVFVIRHLRREPNGTPGLYRYWSKDGWSGIVRHPTTGRVDHVNSNNGPGPTLPDGWEWVSED